MKKRTKIILATLVATVIGGSIYMINEKESFNNLFGRKTDLRSEKEKQLDYLKEHEEDIINFVKSQNPKIETVEVDWSQTRWEQIGNGTPWGGGDVVNVYGRFNNIQNSSWQVMFNIEDGKVNMNSKMLVNDLGIGGDIFE